MKKVVFSLLTIFFAFSLLSQNFLPPDNVQVDDGHCILSWEPPTLMQITDSLDNYNVGDYLALESPNWTTWSNAPGSEEDALITDYLLYWNSAKIEEETNLIMVMDNYASGRYSLHINMFIPEGFSGHFNLQKTNTPGEEYGFQIFFKEDSIATINAGGEASFEFPFWNGRLELDMIIDLDNDWAEFYYYDYLMIEYQWSLGAFGDPGLLSIGAVNISTEIMPGSNDTALFYIRTVSFKEQLTNVQGLTGYNIYLDGMPEAFNVSPYPLEYIFWDLVLGEQYVAGISAVYENPAGESEIIEVEFTNTAGGFIPWPPENLVASVINYNEVELNWELPMIVQSPLYGYKVYRNDELIFTSFNPTLLTYTDSELMAGFYEYYIKCIYINPTFLSEPSNSAYETITLPAPINAEATVLPQNMILIEWEAPPILTRDLAYYRVYRDGTIIADNVSDLFYVDSNVSPGYYIYNITAVYDGGWESEFSNDAPIYYDAVDNILIPISTELTGNHPNPFNPSTTITFSLFSKDAGNAEISIYNLKGQKIRQYSIFNPSSAGQGYQSSIIWNGTDENNQPVSSGIYFYKLNVNGKTEAVKKCLLLK